MNVAQLSLQSLPLEMADHIFHYLDLKALEIFGMTSKESLNMVTRFSLRHAQRNFFSFVEVLTAYLQKKGYHAEANELQLLKEKDPSLPSSTIDPKSEHYFNEMVDWQKRRLRSTLMKLPFAELKRQGK